MRCTRPVLPLKKASWLAAASPSLLYSLASLGAFGWLVLKR